METYTLGAAASRLTLTDGVPPAAQYLSGPETARLNGVTRQAVSLAIQAGRLPAVRQGRCYRIKKSDALAWQPRQRKRGNHER